MLPLEQLSSQDTLDASLLIGIPLIDSEHRSLVSRLDILINSPCVHLHSEAFSKLLCELGHQLTDHFDHEEKIMDWLGMPPGSMRRHIEAHTEIVSQYTNLNLDMMHKQQIDYADVLKSIRSWVIGHVVDHDVKIRDFLKLESGP